MMRHKLGVLDKNHRDLHAMGRLYTNLEQNLPSRKKVRKSQKTNFFVSRGKMRPVIDVETGVSGNSVVALYFAWNVQTQHSFNYVKQNPPCLGFSSHDFQLFL